MTRLVFGCVLLAGGAGVASAADFAPAGETVKAVAILSAPASYDRPSADRFTTLSVSARCSPTVKRTNEITLGWVAKRKGIQAFRVWRQPLAALTTLLSPVGTFADKWRMALLRRQVLAASVDEIYTSHMIEHLNPEELESAVREWRRVLKPGAKITVRCPNFEVYLREWLAGHDEYRLGWGRINIFGHSGRGEGMWHHIGFSPGLLRLVFEKHGIPTLKSQASPTRPEYDNTLEYRADGDLIYEGERLPDAAGLAETDTASPVQLAEVAA